MIQGRTCAETKSRRGLALLDQGHAMSEDSCVSFQVWNRQSFVFSRLWGFVYLFVVCLFLSWLSESSVVATRIYILLSLKKKKLKNYPFFDCGGFGVMLPHGINVGDFCVC